ncbi:hypothetical protein [Halosimplex pelagicum]|uniref:Uncharacterized protein n=1 Tax=Halosimplex pelagicum TaxID=869886 RepID=A0A7D5PEA7_9EURY|nr:hypothetical protein [Halosimplex pelagicum]QLH81279.1 hypothetical protein HZS54_06360 [Halosimplex pelagicum]
MPNNDPTLQEGIADQLAHDAHYLGTDGDGATHYWSCYERTVYVVEDNEVDSWAFAETPLSTLTDWLTHVETKRGPWDDHRVSTGGIATIIAGHSTTECV